MPQNLKPNKWKYTLARVLLFCVSTAVALATASWLTQNMPAQWSQHLLIIIVIIVTFVLTALFARWETLNLGDIGVVPNRHSFSRFCIGFGIGLFLALLQPILVVASGHLKLVSSTSVSLSLALSNFLLYFLIACREELAFRAYPLRSLNYVIGSWKAQLIIAIIFSVEHIAGGMKWQQAFLGPGVGAILFGIAALRTKGIALPIGLHTAWNFGQSCMGFKKEPGLWQAVGEKGYENKLESIGFISYLMVMGLGIFAFFYYRHKSPTGLNRDKPRK